MFETLLEKYTIEVVVNRTKISRRNLEKLRDRDFEGFTRPQAFGFIQILEREFGEDFSDLKAELEAYLDEAQPAAGEPVVLREERPKESGSKRWIAAVVGISVLILGVYLFQKEYGNAVIKPKAERNVSLAAEGLQAREEKNVSISESSPAASEKIATTGEKVSGEKMAKKSEENGTSAAQSVGEEEEKAAYVPLEPVALTPVVKLWFGIVDLKTKKRVAKVTGNPYEIDAHGKKLLVTGHGRFEISDAFGNLFKFNDAKKHYFLIDDGLVKEIDASEFRRLNGGKVW